MVGVCEEMRIGRIVSSAFVLLVIPADNVCQFSTKSFSFDLLSAQVTNNSGSLDFLLAFGIRRGSAE